jgi:hypothetical protein
MKLPLFELSTKIIMPLKGTIKSPVHIQTEITAFAKDKKSNNSSISPRNNNNDVSNALNKNMEETNTSVDILDDMQKNTSQIIKIQMKNQILLKLEETLQNHLPQISLKKPPKMKRTHHYTLVRKLRKLHQPGRQKMPEHIYTIKKKVVKESPLL